MNASEVLKGFAMKQVYSYLDKDPEANLPNLLDMLEKYDKNGQAVTTQVEGIRASLSDPNNNWSKLVKSLWTDIDDEQRKKLVETVVINGTLIGTPATMKMQDKYQCNVPWAILMDPTSACNLRCTGCWAAEYGNKLNLSYEQLDSIICQGKELGTYVYIYSGGEPLVRKADLIRLCEKHDDCAFLTFTNGTLIDDAFADEMLRVKNLVPAISIEGFEEATDFRRGEGTYRKVIEAMTRLKERKLLFGISCCYTSKNVEVIGSEEYFDSMIDMGAKFAWLFTYMPIGAAAVPELIATAEQRKSCMSRSTSSARPSPSLRWTSGTTATRSAAASPADAATATSMPTATWSPAHSFTTPIPTSKKKRCLSAISPRSLWPIAAASPSMTTCCVPAPYWITPAV